MTFHNDSLLNDTSIYLGEIPLLGAGKEQDSKWKLFEYSKLIKLVK
jgi:hypothetical protein